MVRRYGESAIQLPVRAPRRLAIRLSPFLVLGADGAVAAGRELYGQPKKRGEIELAPDGDLLARQAPAGTGSTS